MNDWISHSSHWGAFSARLNDDYLQVVPHPDDPDPAPILDNIPDAPRHRSRIARPAFRRGWLENGPGPDSRRGSDDYIEMDWDQAIPLIVAELRRIKESHGPEAIFGGSYGWSSAGRFHHAQSQVHRFLNLAMGGYISSVGTYSAGAAATLLPHVIGPLLSVARWEDTWGELAELTDMVIAFGGMPTRNSRVSAGGVSRHVALPSMRRAHARGARFINFSPLRDDIPAEVAPEWYPCAPMTDVAVMLGMAHVLISEDLYDKDFVTRCCTGFDQLAAYVMGTSDGTPKTPDWSETISGIDAGQIRQLARDAVKGRTLVTVSHSIQRSEMGEQPLWMAIALAALIGKIGQPGSGFAYSLGAIGNVGRPALAVPLPTLGQGKNPVRRFIPVARISDMLLNPGQSYPFDGQTLTYPDIKLVYWAGGNPFHHHQDLSRLREAFSRPDTIILHDPFWTASARHADIVLPATITLERNDIGASQNDTKMVAMKQVVPPFAQARDDYEIFADIAEAMDLREAYTEGHNQSDWLKLMYEPTRTALAEMGLPAPSFQEFWEAGEIELPLTDKPGLIRAFAASPETAPLPTPSGRVELYSRTIASFRYDDCQGHPKWLEPVEWLGGDKAASFPMQLVANQPANRLHSQLDFGAASQRGKSGGRETARLNPADAADRGIATGDTLRIFNDRGTCYATAEVTDAVRPRVVQLPTGAWFTPVSSQDPACTQGNPNAVTRDIGTSSLTQGCAGQLCLVEITRHDEPLPAIDPYSPPLAAP